MGKTHHTSVAPGVLGLYLNTGGSDPTEEGQMTYDDSLGFRAYGISGVFTIGSGGSATGGSDTLDSAYENGRALVLDAGAITFANSTTGTNSMEFTVTGASTKAILDLSIDAAVNTAFNAIAIDMNLGIAGEAIFIDNGGNARTGSDILVTADGSGTHSVLDVNETGTGDTKCVDVVTSGTGATTGLYYEGAYAGSPAGYGVNIVLGDSDGLDTIPILITAGTGTRDSALFQIVSTGTGSGALIDLSMDGDATGAGITIDGSGALGANLVYLDAGAGTRTAHDMSMLHDGDGNVSALYIQSTSTGTAALIDIYMNGNGSDGGVIACDMHSAVDAEFLALDAGAGARSVDLFTINDDASGNTNTFCITSASAGAGSVFEILCTGDRQLPVFNIDMDAALDAIGINFDGTAAVTRTEPYIYFDHQGDGNVGLIASDIVNTGSGNAIEIKYGDAINTGDALHVDFVGAAASTGSGLYVDMGTNVAGHAISILTAGAASSSLILINGAGTDAGTDDHLIDINQSGQLDSNVLDITYSSAASTGNAVDINMGTAVAGGALNIDLTGVRSAPAIVIGGNMTDAGTDDHIMQFAFTGQVDSNIIDITYSSAASTGEAISVNMGTNVAGRAIEIDSSGTGAAHEGCAIDVTHDGNLATNADLVNITSSGSISATSNLLAIEQATGACTSGAFGLYINVTGTNIEAIKVDAGNVVLDEDLSVGGTLTVTGISTLADASVLGTHTYKDLTEVVAATNTIGADETGKVMFLNHATEFASTLPAPAAGLHYTFVVTAAPSGASYTVGTNAAATIIYGSVASAEDAQGSCDGTNATAVATITFADGKAVIGDYVEMWCDGTSWFARGLSFVQDAITFT